LKEMVAAGTFREDLYYRLNVINLSLPPLRERSSDIPSLAMHFVKRCASENGKRAKAIAPDALARIVSYPWPGNVRELENVIERAVLLADGEQVELGHLPPELGVVSIQSGPPPIPGSTMGMLERYAILRTMESVAGSTSKAADILGMSVRKIQYKLHEYSAAPKSRRAAAETQPRQDPAANQ